MGLSKNLRSGLGLLSAASARVRASIGYRLSKVKSRKLVFDQKSFPLRQYVRRRLGLRGKPHGVNLVAYIRAEMGLGEASRGMALAMEAARVPFNVVNFEYGNPSRHQDTSWAHKEVGDSDYDITVLGINFDNVVNARLRLPKGLFERYVVANWYWELPDFPDEWVHTFSAVNEIWVATRFVQDALSRKSPVPVVRIPPVVRVAPAARLSRADFRLPERRFLFLAMCDTRSVLERKNPVAAVRAFKQAFPKNSPGVGLVMKLNNPDYRQPEFERLAEEVRGCDNVYVIEQILPREELDSLISLTDCFVSLHRSEGFGLGPAEAMSLGKPVVVTNWSGNTDYMTPDNSAGVGYELVRLDKDYGPYKAHQHWAEPDVAQAAHWMRRLFDEPQLAERMGELARRSIAADFSPAAVGRLIEERLKYIRAGLLGG